MPVFFIQDGIKFPDFVHAVKPEPHNEIPQAVLGARHAVGLRLAAARDDAHGDVADVRPRAAAQLPDDAGLRRPHLPASSTRRAKGTFVKFHWRPGARHALAGLGRGAEDRRQGPRLPPPRPVGGDRGRRLPRVGVRRADSCPRSASTTSTSTCSTRRRSSPRRRCRCASSGACVLDRNPDNFFAETEQAAFHVAQRACPASTSRTTRCCRRRLFSYLDTQLIRLGGPNFAQIPINRPGRRGAPPPARRLRPAPDRRLARSPTTRTRSAAAARASPRSTRAPSVTTPSVSTGRRSASAARASRTTSVRRRSSGTR